jgi:Rieske Fe-S protein
MDEHALPELDPGKGSWAEEAFSRRRFFRLGFWTATSLTTLVVGGASARFFVGHAFEPANGQWVSVGDLVDIPPGQVHKVQYSVRAFDAWRETEARGILYAFSTDGIEYTVLDATCTHLGCNVRWQEGMNHFACPCHGGFFTRDGEVISGPPPEALGRLETRTENGVLLALV